MNDSYWNHIERAYEKVSIYDGETVFLRAFEKQAVQVRHLLAAHWFLSELSNGGFDQFFLNPTGVLAPEAADAFEAMGLSDVGALIRQQMGMFGSAYPRDEVKRAGLLDEIPVGAFESAETKIYEIGGRSLSKIYDIMGAFAAKST